MCRVKTVPLSMVHNLFLNKRRGDILLNIRNSIIMRFCHCLHTIFITWIFVASKVTYVYNLLGMIFNEILKRKEQIQQGMGRMQSVGFHKNIIGNKMNTCGIRYYRDGFEWMLRKKYIYLPAEFYRIKIKLKNMDVINCAVWICDFCETIYAKNLPNIHDSCLWKWEI